MLFYLCFCLQELQEAKKYGTKNKRQALQCLRRKKKLEEQLMHIDGILNRIQTQKDSLENASVNASVLSTLADSAKALKHAHNDMDVDKVHDLMEEITEQQELANEIAEAISNPMGMDNMDEDDLLAELEKLEEVSYLLILFLSSYKVIFFGLLKLCHFRRT